MTEWFEKLNIIARVRALEKKVNNNITKITEFRRFIDVDVNGEGGIVDTINSAIGELNIIREDIKDIATDAIQASNTAIDAKNVVTTILEKVKIAETMAADALKNAQGFIDRLTSAGDNIANDILAVKTTGEHFLSIMITELSGIGETIVEFGQAVYNKAKTVGEDALGMAAEMIEAVQQIGKPLSDVIRHIKKFPYELISDPSTVRLDDVISFAKNAFKAFAYLASRDIVTDVLHDTDYGGSNRAVLGEMIEAFSEIGEKMDALGGSMKDFALTVVNESKNLNERVKVAYDLINKSFLAFVNAFHNVFVNMSYHLKGLEPPA